MSFLQQYGVRGETGFSGEIWDGERASEQASKQRRHSRRPRAPPYGFLGFELARRKIKGEEKRKIRGKRKGAKKRTNRWAPPAAVKLREAELARVNGSLFEPVEPP